MFAPSLTPGKPFLHPQPSCLLGTFPPSLGPPKSHSQSKCQGRRVPKRWEAQTHHILKDGPGAGKAQDGPSDDVDAPVIGGVELEGNGVDQYPCISSQPFSFSCCPIPCHPMPSHPAVFPLTSSTMEPNSRSRYSCLAQARMVDVFPVPGGP